MKTFLASLMILDSLLFGRAAATINSTNKYAHSANLGWMDWRGDTNGGAIIGEYVCSGYIYGANVGWINLGSGTPTNGIAYQNLSANDFGVNQDGLGNLRGYAWGANIGWINFESNGAPKVDLKSGRMTGYIYSANCGWISLSNAFAYVQTDIIAPGAVGTNGLPIAWQLLNFGNTNVNPNADPDGDGMNNLQEYLAGTDPNNLNSKLAITTFSTSPSGASNYLSWQSVLTRCYYVQERLSLNNGFSWFDSGLGLIGPDGASTASTILGTNGPLRFYRVQAIRPLSP